MLAGEHLQSNIKPDNNVKCTVKDIAWTTGSELPVL
jgi:hypothetical protein